MAQSLLRVIPKIPPKLDPDFRPAYLGNKRFLAAVKKSGRSVPLQFALEGPVGVIGRYDTLCFKSRAAGSQDNNFYAERILKYLLWARGGFRVYVNAPKEVLAHLQQAYKPKGSRAFDADFFAGIYEAKKFEILGRDAAKMPKSNEVSQPIGRHLEGCRIGFDAGGSDRKVAAVIDGRQVFTTETVWEPKLHSDPQYHIDGINDSIAQAAAHLPRIDAIGVSSAGIFVDNRCRAASLFRKVPKKLFDRKLKNVFLDVAKKWGSVPIEVANDGDVTALAGSMSLNDNAVLGIAMGTSQAVGYVDKLGHVTGWLNELAFAPVDYSQSAPEDSEWSGDLGTGVNYFSQDAVIRLAGKLGIPFNKNDAPGSKLKAVQALLKRDDKDAKAIFETLGCYLGYAILQYAQFYDLKHVLLLGRVTSGAGGDLILAQCKKVMAAENPALSRLIKVKLPDEASRRVGQAIAAASLPRIKTVPITQPNKKVKPK